MQTPIAPKQGIELLEKLNLIEFSVEAAIIGDNGPLTSSPTQRRNMALVMADVAATLSIIATRIDPLADPAPEEKIIAWEAARAAREQPATALPDDAFRLPAGAFEEAMAKA